MITRLSFKKPFHAWTGVGPREVQGESSLIGKTNSGPKGGFQPAAAPPCSRPGRPSAVPFRFLPLAPKSVRPPATFLHVVSAACSVRCVGAVFDATMQLPSIIPHMMEQQQRPTVQAPPIHAPPIHPTVQAPPSHPTVQAPPMHPMQAPQTHASPTRTPPPDAAGEGA